MSALEEGLYKMIDRGKLIMVVHTHVGGVLVAFEKSAMRAQRTIEALSKERALQGGVRNHFEYLSRVVDITEDLIRTTLAKSAKSPWSWSM